MAKRCFNCKSTDLHEVEYEDSLSVAGHNFTRTLPAARCAKCGEQTISGEAIGTFEVEVAAELARHGEASAESFCFMRRALGVKALDLADLLDVTPETVSRWEHDRQRIDRGAAALLSAMVLDRIEGHTKTLDRLRALREPTPLPQLVRLVPRVA